VDLRLEGSNKLEVGYFSPAKRIPELEYFSAGPTTDLDLHLGNDDGSFQFGGVSFSQSAKNVRVAGAAIVAELRSVSGVWLENRIGVDVRRTTDSDTYIHFLVPYHSRHSPSQLYYDDKLAASTLDHSFRNEVRLPGSADREQVCTSSVADY
jgi:hypothetical protein